MKKILVINPIATDEWNDSDRRLLQQQTSEDTVIDLVSLEQGPSTIETFRDIVLAGPGIMQAAENESKNYDGIMINCFADPGLEVLRETCNIPVTAPCESSLAFVSLLGLNFSVVATLRKLYPVFETKCLKMGLMRRLNSFRVINLGVKELEEEPGITIKKIVREINQSAVSGAQAAILGCTGMLPFYTEIKKGVEIPVIEPATSALKMLESLIEMKLSYK